MDYDLGTDAVELRTRLRELISTHIPEGFLGACTNDPKDLATTESFCKMLASDGLLALAWPKEHGGGGGSVWQQTVLREEMWAHHEPRGAQYMGINWVGPALMRYGTRRAESPAPVRDRRRRSDLVPGVLRAGGRNRPRVAAHPRGSRRRRVARHRTEGLDVLCADGVVVRAGGLHRSGRSETQAAQPVSGPDGPDRHHRATDPVDARTAPPQRGISRRRRGVRRRGPRRSGRRLAGDARGAGLRAGRHRPLRPVRVAAGPDADRTRRRLGRAARVDPDPLGAGVDRSADRPAAGLSRGVATG